jgi:2-(1,2-epoxy-1,2-dihydrophenyl)acetyl-CoA isomerase
MSANEVVVAERFGNLAVVTLNRPQRRNGITVEMCERLHETLQQVAAGDARVVVLRGAGDHFSVGGDLDGGEPTGPATLERLGPSFHAATLLHTMPQVTICAIDGGCAGAALGWALACDFRFASDRARFATAFLNVGVAGDMGVPWTLSRVVGAARARELMFFPSKVTAEQALGFGLVTRTFPAEALHAEVRSLAEELAARPAFVLRMMKANLLAAERMGLEDYIELESARHLHMSGGPAWNEAVAARFKGKGR